MFRTSSLFLGPWEFVFQQHRRSDHLDEPHDPFNPVDIRKPQGLAQFEANGLLLAFINGDVCRVKVHAVEIVEDGVEPPGQIGQMTYSLREHRRATS